MSLLRKLSFILVALGLLAAQSAILVSPAYAAASRVYAKDVKEDKNVTLVGTSLRPNTRYNVYLSKYGKYPANAILVGFALTDEAGSFTKTFRIPGRLVDIAKIGINLTSSHGDTASNWFINATSSNNTPEEGSPPFTFKVTSVNKGDSVKIKAFNLPANVTFDVRMGKAGSQGINGTRVGELRTSKGGTVTGTFDIPEALKTKSQIDVGVENENLGIASFVRINNK